MITTIMNIEEVRAIVESTNSFSKEAIANNRALIRKCREEKKSRLAAVGGSYVGTVVDRAKEAGFVLTDIKEKSGKKTDTVTITLKRANQLSEEDRIKAEIAKLTNALAKLTTVNV